MTILTLATPDTFLQKHVREINRAYNKACYTCVFVLTRKVFENMVVAILRSKFPSQPELYLDTKRGRQLDFEAVLKNLYDRRNEFSHEGKKAIERLNGRLKQFKNDANDKAHSLFHIVETRKEVDDWRLQTIVELFAKVT